MKTVDPVAAHAFGLVMRREVERAGLTQADVAAAARITQPLVSQFCRGVSLPSMDVASRLSDSLMAPVLLHTVKRLRTAKCPACKEHFVRTGGNRRVYCSPGCVRLMHKKGVKPRQVPAERRAIVAMCRSCEPQGLCRQAACPLRPFSPLPLAENATAAMAFHVDRRKLAWQGEGAEARRAEFSERMREVWTDPEERERRTRSNASTWARATEEQRAAHGLAISEGRRRAGNSAA